MKISLIALVALGATNAFEKLGGATTDKAKFPTGVDTSSHGSTDSVDDEPTPAPAEDPAPAPPSARALPHP